MLTVEGKEDVLVGAADTLDREHLPTDRDLTLDEPEVDTLAQDHRPDLRRSLKKNV